MADEFCKSFDRMMAKYTLKSENKRPYHRDNIKLLKYFFATSESIFELTQIYKFYSENHLPESTFPVKKQQNLGWKSTRSVWVEGDE